MTKSYDSVRQEARRLAEAANLVMEANAEGMHHYASGVDDAPDDKGNYSKASTTSLKKAGAAAKAIGAKVSYSTGAKGNSTSLSSKHNMVHISHHDKNAVHKALAKAGHVSANDHDFTQNQLKSKTHGGHSDSTAEYHQSVAGGRS